MTALSHFPSSQIQLSNSRRKPTLRRPCSLRRGVRRRLFHPAFVPRGWSAAWRTSKSALGARCASRVETHAPCGAPSAAFLSPGPCFRARTEGLAANRIQAAFAALHPHRVQPLKAVPLSGDGRRAGASRARGYESRPRAPRQPVWLSPFRPSQVAPSSRRLATTPSAEQGKRTMDYECGGNMEYNPIHPQLANG